MFDPFTWRVWTPTSGGLGDHGMSIVSIILLIVFAAIYYRRSNHSGVLKSLLTSLMDGYIIAIVITVFFTWVAYTPTTFLNILVSWLVPSGIFSIGLYLIPIRCLFYCKKLSDFKYTILWVTSYAPFIAFWRYALGGVKFSSWNTAYLNYFPVQFWEVILVVYCCAMYYAVVVRQLK